MKKPKYYTKANWKICGILATFFSIAYFVSRSIVFTSLIISWSEKILAVVGGVDICLPILVLLSWSMCVERYLYLEAQMLETKGCKQTRRQANISVAIVIVLGLLTFLQAIGIVFFVSEHWEYIGKLYDCIVIKAVMEIVWCVCLIYSIKKKEIIKLKIEKNKKDCLKDIIVLILIFALACVTTVYTYSRAENEWFYNMIEEA